MSGAEERPDPLEPTGHEIRKAERRDREHDDRDDRHRIASEPIRDPAEAHAHDEC